MINKPHFLKSIALAVELVIALLLLPIAIYAANNSAPQSAPVHQLSDTNTSLIKSTNALLTFCDGVSEIPTTECNALVDLYNSTNGANWTNHTDWLVTTTPCSWHGIGCDLGHVLHLYLGANNLSGSIPTSIGNLSGLLEIFFYGNNLSGSIPTSMGSLLSLQVLNMGFNSLSGSIPLSLGSLTNLQDLRLNTNQLINNIPLSLGSLSNLKYLDLAYNQLSGIIPSSLGELTNLISMGLNSNALTGPIPDLHKLTKLQGIGLTANQLSGGIPSTFGDLISLQVLDLLNDNLSGSIPPELGKLTNLKHVELAFNHLTGRIPVELGNLVNLQEIFLAHNRLSESIPKELGNLTNLTLLDMADNQLKGDIPRELANLTNMQTFAIEFNMLTASDANLITWLNAKQPNWDNSQTVPPTNVQAVTLPNHDMRVSWTPILYTNHGGYYKVGYSSSVNGPFTTLGCITADKTVPSCDISNLSSTTAYYFAVQTFTPAHADSFQENNLLSIFSASVPGAGSAPLRNYFTSTTPTLTWNRITGAAQYTVEISKSPTFSPLVYPAVIVAADQLSLNVAALPGKGVYYWRVSGNNGLTWSASDSFTIGLP